VSEEKQGPKPTEGVAPTPPARDSQGRLLPGNTANPGGLGQEMTKFRALLKALHPHTVAVARKVLGRAEDTSALEAIVDNAEAPDEIRLEAENALNARLKLGTQMVAEVWRYSVAKPIQRHKVAGQLSNPLAPLTTEEIQDYLRRQKEEKDGK